MKFLRFKRVDDCDLSEKQRKFARFDDGVLIFRCPTWVLDLLYAVVFAGGGGVLFIVTLLILDKHYG